MVEKILPSQLIAWQAAASGVGTFIANNLLAMKLEGREYVTTRELILSMLIVFIGSLIPILIVQAGPYWEARVKQWLYGR